LNQNCSGRNLKPRQLVWFGISFTVGVTS